MTILDKMEKFDGNAFIAEAKPFYKALYDLAEKHGVPMLVAACVANNERGVQMNGCYYFNGEARTPVTLAVAKEFALFGIKNGLQATRELIMPIVLAGHTTIGGIYEMECPKVFLDSNADPNGTKH